MSASYGTFKASDRAYTAPVQYSYSYPQDINLAFTMVPVSPFVVPIDLEQSRSYR